MHRRSDAKVPRLLEGTVALTFDINKHIFSSPSMPVPLSGILPGTSVHVLLRPWVVI